MSSVLVSVERQTERFYWIVAYCCYSVLNLLNKLKVILRHSKILQEDLIGFTDSTFI